MVTAGGVVAVVGIGGSSGSGLSYREIRREIKRRLREFGRVVPQ
jgi:hypothetical protein